MEIGGGKVMSQAARTFISGCTGWISEFVVAPRPLARAGVGKREEVGRGGGVHSPLDGELIHVWNSSDLWPPTSASLSPPPSLSLSLPPTLFFFPSDFNAIVVTRSFSLSPRSGTEECFLARNLCRQFLLFPLPSISSFFSDTGAN